MGEGRSGERDGRLLGREVDESADGEKWMRDFGAT